MKPFASSLRSLLSLVALSGALWAQVPIKGPAEALRPYGRTVPQNLGLASTALAVGDGLVAFQVSEAAQGSTNLNGDLDANDIVLHLWDAAVGGVVNLGLASGGMPIASGRRVFFLVSESDQGGQDLNGDGDAVDQVLHVLDADAATVMNLGLAAWGPRVDGNRVAFLVPEYGQGADLNGDGDMLDDVLHVYDAQYGLVRNLARACANDVSYVLAGDVVVLAVEEGDQGGVDLNGDGDAWDAVLAVHLLLPGITYNTALCPHLPLPQIGTDGTLVALMVRESAQGLDLNGDGDVLDEVLHVLPAATGVATNLGVAGARMMVAGNAVAFQVVESGQGVDLNNDGDTKDNVYHVYRAGPAKMMNLMLAGAQFAMDFDGARVAFLVVEWADGYSDHNGDGDTEDWVLFTHELATAATVNRALACGQYPALERDLAIAVVRENAQGATDLNGDGDASDEVIVVIDPATGSLHGPGLAMDGSTFTFAVDGHLLAFRVNEASQGGADLNADGDAVDLVAHLYDTRRGITWNLGHASREPFVHGGLVGFLVLESLDGAADWNGDGDAMDEVTHVATP